MSDCHTIPAPTLNRSAEYGENTRTIALVGQPNLGKSTLFNLLTGLNQHVGNWPGKTVERREGEYAYNGFLYHLVDLPGTYSLTANSPEEVITREYILRQAPNVVIAVVSAANLERSLYLVSELVSLPVRLVVALNMMDVAEQEGILVSAPALESRLGVSVVPMTATRAEGVQKLLAIVEQAIAEEITYSPNPPEVKADHRLVLDEIVRQINGHVPSPYPTEWTALKLLEGDAEITRTMQAALPVQNREAIQVILRQHDDALLAVASGRYEWIGQMVQAAVERPKIGQISLTERLDRWAAHPFYGLFILAGILGVVFWLTFKIGAPVQNWLSVQVIARLALLVHQMLLSAPAWLTSLVANGIIGGVGAVITFLPIMVIFFATFAFLEDIGYMARAAYVMDNLMHIMGLHGKSFLPLFLGFGCNVPSVMGTRVVDSRPGRLLTIIIAPFVPCTARMAVLAFLAPAFFGPKAFYVTWGLVLLSIFTLVSSGTLLSKVLFKGQRLAFIMEMPLYHLPNVRTIGLLVLQRSMSFMKKAGTNILAMALVIWALSVLPGGSMNTSYLAQFGKLIEPIGSWMGLDWRLMVALISSFPAKENAIATLGVLFGSTPAAGLAQTLTASFSTASALSFLVVTMLFIPCMATVAVIHQETGSLRWTLLNIGLMFAVSFTAGIAVYHLAVLFRI